MNKIIVGKVKSKQQFRLRDMQDGNTGKDYKNYLIPIELCISSLQRPAFPK